MPAVAHVGEEVTKNRAATNALDFLVGTVSPVCTSLLLLMQVAAPPGF